MDSLKDIEKRFDEVWDISFENEKGTDPKSNIKLFIRKEIVQLLEEERAKSKRRALATADAGIQMCDLRIKDILEGLKEEIEKGYREFPADIPSLSRNIVFDEKIREHNKGISEVTYKIDKLIEGEPTECIAYSQSHNDFCSCAKCKQYGKTQKT